MEASWIVHVLFLLPLLLVASGWILGIWICPHGLFAAPWLVSVKGRERKMRIWEWDHPGVLSPGSKCSIAGSWWWLCWQVCVGTIPCCLTQSTPYSVPHWACWMGKSRLAPWFSRHPVLSVDVLGAFRIQRQGSCGTVLFSLCLHALGTSSFICVLVLRKVRTQTAQMEQCSIYLLLFPIFLSQDLESLSSR